MTISDDLRRDVNAQQTGEQFIFLVTIEHPDLPAPLRINDSVQNVESRGEIYLANFIRATIVDQDPDRSPQAQISMSNIRREIVIALQSTPVPCTLTMELIRASAPDYVEISLTNLELKNVTGDEMVIQGDLIPRRLRAKKAVDYYFTPTTAPGLF